MRGPTTLVVIALALVLLSGCTGVGFGESPTTVGPTTSPGADDVSATVVRVIDGDTVEVAYDNGVRDTVRLLGLDTPETNSRTDPAAFEGVSDSTAGRACLREWGDRASEYATAALEGESVTLVFDDLSPRRDSFGRLLAYVYTDGESFNRRLVDDGYARLYDTPFEERETYREAEREAREAGRGVWTCADTSPTATDSPLAVVEVHADAAGADGDNLNDEYVVLRNGGESPLDLSGWAVRDEAAHEHRIPDGVTLAPGASVTLHTGSGTDTESDLYWGATSPVWNNGGDTVTVVRPDGTVAASLSYP